LLIGAAKKQQDQKFLLQFCHKMILSSELLLQAYMSGAFPMAHPEQDNAIYWHTPAVRGIIPLDERFIVPKNLQRLYRQNKFDLYINRAFGEVIQNCAALRYNDTWISDEIVDSYTSLHENGFAHSFEAWQDGELVGGLYGVSIGKAFFGESMFFKVRDASKVALIFLVEFLREQKFQLLDTQYLNPHLVQFGAYEVSHEVYMEMLEKAIAE
jgi:leucyl/phenylalanyl-tRNA--protein transferase